MKAYLVVVALAVLAAGCASQHDKAMDCISSVNAQVSQGNAFEDAAVHDKARSAYQDASIAADGCRQYAVTDADKAEVAVASAGAHIGLTSVLVDEVPDANSPGADDAAKQAGAAGGTILAACGLQDKLSETGKTMLLALLPKYVEANNSARTKLEGKTFSPGIRPSANLKDACDDAFKATIAP